MSVGAWTAGIAIGGDYSVSDVRVDIRLIPPRRWRQDRYSYVEATRFIYRSRR